MRDNEFLSNLRRCLVELQPHQTLDLDIKHVRSWVAARPPYCDRGRFMWQVEPVSNEYLTIDWADGFPRYYFTVEAAELEIGAWLSARSLVGQGVSMSLASYR